MLTAIVAVLVMLIVMTAGLAVGKTRRFAGDVAINTHATTTPNAEAVYPFVVDHGFDVGGVYIGEDCMTGAEFLYDGWELYRHNNTTGFTSPNIMMAGEVGKGKSSLVKSYVYRQVAFGRRAVIIDPKGEFRKLAEAVGGTVIDLGPGTGTTINPLDTGDEDQCCNLLEAILGGSLGRHLSAREEQGLQAAVHYVLATIENPTLRDAWEALIDPSEAQSVPLRMTVDALRDSTDDVACEVKRLCDGSLKGMFNRPTNINVDWNAPIVVIDISALGETGGAHMKVAMAAALAWIRPIITGPGPQRLLVIDEAWRLLADRVLAQWLRELAKLARQYGLANLYVVHRLADFNESSAETAEQAWGLLRDTGTQVFFAQSPKDAELAQQQLGLSDTARDLLSKLPPHVCLFKVAGRVFLVRVVLSESEQVITNTDGAMIRQPVAVGS